MFYFNAPGKAKAHPIEELMKELFSPEDHGNKASTLLLEEITAVMAEAWTKELIDPN